MGAFNSLEPLDDISQVIYHALRRFVLISNAAESTWKLSLALKSNPSSDLPGSYLWHASLTEERILQLTGSGARKASLSTISTRIYDAIVESDLEISDFDEDIAASSLRIILNPKGDDPMAVDLKLLAPHEALAIAVDFAFNVCLQANSGTRPSNHRISAARSQTRPTTEAQADHVLQEAFAHKKRNAESLTSEDDGNTRYEIRKFMPPATNSRAQLPPMNDSKSPSKSKASATRVKRVAKKMQFESDED